MRWKCQIEPNDYRPTSAMIDAGLAELPVEIVPTMTEFAMRQLVVRIYLAMVETAAHRPPPGT